MWGALFPGQGSQSVGMGRFLFEEFASARQLFEEAGDTLKINFKKLCFEGPEADLQLTENTQPALLLVSTVASTIISKTTAIKFSAASGHSVGEYAALVASGVLSFPDALRAVRRRGQAMQIAVPQGKGAMCAVLGLKDELVTQLCLLVEKESGSTPLEAANFNCPGQVVVSGSSAAVEWMRVNVKPEWLTKHFGAEVGRAKFIPLAVSAPFHCTLMKPAEIEMRTALDAMTFSTPRFPVVQNLTADSTNETRLIRDHLVGQISGTVLWTQCQQNLMLRGIDRYVELGSGRVLAGLAKKIAGENIKVYGINSIEDLKILENEIN